MSAQLVSLIVMFFAGVMVGAVIDAVRHIVSLLPKKSIIYKLSYFIELIFWVLLGVVTFYFLFLIKGGNWRVIDPLAQIIGIFSYDLFFQRLIRFVGRVFVNIIIRPFIFIGHLFVLCIRQMVRFVVFLVGPIGKNFKKSKKQG